MPENIRKAIKVGKFRKNMSHGSKPSSNIEEFNPDIESPIEKIGVNLQVRKIFNFMPPNKSNGPPLEPE